jgi:hypothetical protein
MIARLICMWKGHRRGKRIESQDNGALKRFQCPRCKRITTYKRGGSNAVRAAEQ